MASAIGKLHLGSELEVFQKRDELGFIRDYKSKYHASTRQLDDSTFLNLM